MEEQKSLKIRKLMQDAGCNNNFIEEYTQERLADWDAKYINDLPDMAFAVIQPGGKKDDTGKTVPRVLRHLPHHNTSVKSGAEHTSVDKPHLRNALARVNQISYTVGIPKAKAHLEAHAKHLKIGGRE